MVRYTKEEISEMKHLDVDVLVVALWELGVLAPGRWGRQTDAFVGVRPEEVLDQYRPRWRVETARWLMPAVGDLVLWREGYDEQDPRVARRVVSVGGDGSRLVYLEGEPGWKIYSERSRGWSWPGVFDPDCGGAP